MQNKLNHNFIMACIAFTTLSGAGIVGYTVVKEDIKENSTRLELQSEQNKERYTNITKQLDTILGYLLEQKNQ